MKEYWIEKLMTYTSAHYKFYIKTAQVLFMNSFKKTILSTIYHKNNQSLGIELCKVKENLSNEIT